MIKKQATIDQTDLILLLIIFSIAAFDIYVCVLLVRSDFLSKQQKIAQAMIVWIIPMMGSVLIWCFLRSQNYQSKFDPAASTDRTEKGIDIAINEALHSDHSDQ